MNDFDPTLDELVSAYIDGEATAEEVALIEQSPDLLARVDRLRAVASAVAAPVSAPPVSLRDESIAAALRASDTAANVTSLAARQAWSARAMRLASVAAVIAAVMLAIPLILLSRDSNDSSDSVASADTASESDAAFDAAVEEEPATEPAAEELAAEELAADAGTMDEATGADDEAIPAMGVPAAEADVQAEAAPDRAEDRLVTLRQVIAPQFDERRVAEALLAEIESTGGDGSTEAALDFHPCWATLVDSIDGEILGFTETVLDGVDIGAVAFHQPGATDIRLVSIFELTLPDCPKIALIEP